MRWGMDVAEAADLPVYLESSPKAYPLYQALGFDRLEGETVVHEAELVGEASDVDIPLMVKMPSAAKGVSFEAWAAKGYPPTY